MYQKVEIQKRLSIDVSCLAYIGTHVYTFALDSFLHICRRLTRSLSLTHAHTICLDHGLFHLVTLTLASLRPSRDHVNEMATKMNV